MALQIFGTKKCKRTAKAIRFFRERGVAFHFIRLDDKGISKGELTSVVKSAGLEDLIDTESPQYREKGMKYMDFDPFEEALENPLLINMPIVRDGNRAVYGEHPERWKTFSGK